MQPVPAERVISPYQDAARRPRTRNQSGPRHFNNQGCPVAKGIATPGEIALSASGVAERARDILWERGRSHVGAVLRCDQVTVHAALRSYR